VAILRLVLNTAVFSKIKVILQVKYVAKLRGIPIARKESYTSLSHRMLLKEIEAALKKLRYADDF
jgi:hypothetical protein